MAYAGIGGAVRGAVIGARFGCVMGPGVVLRWVGRGPVDEARPGEGTRTGVVVSWCGMRGIVTLAAALALPDGEYGPAFPHRDLILLCAFVTVVGTLVLQGFSLRPLLAVMKLEDDGVVDREFTTARQRALEAGLRVLEPEQSPAAESLRREYCEALEQANQAADGRPTGTLASNDLRGRAIAASRTALVGLRANGEIGDAAFHQMEERLDWLEMGVAARGGTE